MKNILCNLTFCLLVTFASGQFMETNYVGRAVVSSLGEKTPTVGISGFPECNPGIFLSQDANTSLYAVDNSTNPFTFTPIGSPAGFGYNATGYNPKDGFLYAIKRGNPSTMLKIDPTTGMVEDLGEIEGLPSVMPLVIRYVSGEIDDNGNYYVLSFPNANNDQQNLYKINIENRTATLIRLTESLSTFDFTYNINDEKLYGVHIINYGSSDSSIRKSQLYSIDPTTGVVSFIGSANDDAGVVGAMYGAAGHIYGAKNMGGLYKYNTTTGERTFISSSPFSNAENDGAHCVSSPLFFSTDLYVTKTDGKSSYTAGSSTTYTIIAGNNGPFGVQGAIVRDPVPVGIPAENVSYTAVVSGGASSGITGTMTGSINDVISLPVGGKVTYTVKVHIPVSLTGNLTNTVSIASPPDSNDLDLNNNTATDTNINVGTCVRPGDFTSDGQPTKIGISTQNKLADWPEKVTNGWIALESNSQGMVITRVTHVSTTPDFINDAIKEPKEGMIVYDIQDKCVKLYNGTIWNCIKSDCTATVSLNPVRVATFTDYVLGSTDFGIQMKSPDNYGVNGKYNKISGFTFEDVTNTLTSLSADELLSRFEILSIGYDSNATFPTAMDSKIKDYVKKGGIAWIILDGPTGRRLFNAFGGTGTVILSTNNTNAIGTDHVVNNSFWGDARNVTLYGFSNNGIVGQTQLPVGSTLFAKGISDSTAKIWSQDLGLGKVVFVYDEGVWRNQSGFQGAEINSPQEIFMHNLLTDLIEKIITK
ncbi:DUF11 domain-containing protein [Empedobacter brevis]|uniref:DUF11 domain-containing protein n=1 Tax=Empedobacter brevis TaxID=247 RepID=UPI002FE2A350